MFEIIFSDATVPLTLVEASQMGSGKREGGAFSVLFQGPKSPSLRQSTYPVRHADMGEQTLCLVPVGEKEAGIQYEAILA
jgi:hypothetical protein